MLRYARLLGVQFRASAAIAVHYRAEFLIRAALALLWTGWPLVPILVAFGKRPAIVGWTFEEALVVVGWFTLLKGVLEGAVNPSLTAVVEHIRKGTLDFVLLKPADAQFLVSTAKFEPARIADVVGGIIMFAVAFHRIGRPPTAGAVALGAVLLVAAVAILYSLWILVVSAAFVVVKIDNLSFLFVSIYDAARWPVDVFPVVLRAVFTFVIPLAVMTTFPAEALLGRLGPGKAALIAAGALLFAVLSRVVWLRSIARYTSASS